MAIAWLEKPHCGNSGVPFMNRTTSLDLTMSPMRALTSDMIFETLQMLRMYAQLGTAVVSCKA